jgi:predicted O-methyltransferase YrrM
LFVSADADYWYNIIRLKKPKRIIEIGSGYSTLMALNAVNKNKVEDSNYECKHICIEPYEMSWLSKTNVTLIREKVEEISLDIFKELEFNDILFIDSSHMIRPQGDVLFEYLQIFPSLQKGVIVHLHDIFTPKGYLKSWVMNEVKFWNEQYLLEAFLTSNHEWEILGALNYLRHNHFEKLSSKSPHLTKESEPGSFYMQKIV